LDRAFEALEDRLPRGWDAEISKQYQGVDAYIRITSPDQKRGTIAVEAKRSLDPKDVLRIAASHREGEPLLVIAPYLSKSTRERLAEAGISYLDLTGNARIELARPGLYVATNGADRSPSEPRGLRTLRGPKVGRVIRTLVDQRDPAGVRGIAARSKVDAGYVSRVLSLLDREALVARDSRGKILRVDWVGLLRRWAEESPFPERGRQFRCLDPRGSSGLLRRLSVLDNGAVRLGDTGTANEYAVTGSFVANRYAPVAESRLMTVYVSDAVRAMHVLDLRAVETGTNVLLVEPDDAGVFIGATFADSVRHVALSQAVVDLLGSPGRGPSEGEALIEWMKAHEEAWRE